jgi:pilus assembly protein CpaC
MRRLTGSGPALAKLALAIGLAGSLSVVPGPVLAKDLVVPMGGQHLIDMAQRVTRLAVGDPLVADVQIVSAHQLRVLGVKAGTTDLLVWVNDGRQPFTYHLVVGTDVSSLKAAFAADPDLAGITVHETGRTAVLGGRVPSAAARDRALKLATAELGKGIVDTITIGQTQMVAVEVRFAAVSVTAMKALGINLQRLGNSGFQFASAVPNSLSDFSFLGGTGLSVTSGLPLSRAFNLMMAWPGADFMSTISALSSANLAQMLAKPTLLVRSGETAKFLAGGQIPVPVPQPGAAGNAITIDYHKYGVQLNLKATVLDDERIVVEVNPEVSELDPTNAVRIEGYTIPAIKTRSTHTTIELGDGQSFVLAGLMYSTSSSAEEKLPGIGDLPIIGSFFRQTQNTREQQELIIIATPHLVRPLKPGEAPALPGQNLPPYRPSLVAGLTAEKPLDGYLVEHGLLP